MGCVEYVSVTSFNATGSKQRKPCCFITGQNIIDSYAMNCFINTTEVHRIAIYTNVYKFGKFDFFLPNGIILEVS